MSLRVQVDREFGSTASLDRVLRFRLSRCRSTSSRYEFGNRARLEYVVNRNLSLNGILLGEKCLKVANATTFWNHLFG
jgi:hypothetical protein